MKLIVCENREAAGLRLADDLADAIVANPRLRLCLSAGRTSIHAYEALVQRYHEHGGFSFRHLTVFATDEYVGLSPQDHRSTRYILNYHLFRQVDLPLEQTFIPRGDVPDIEAECKVWDSLIDARGGLDLVVLGLGHNGHVGLNEPGSSARSRMRSVSLTPSTLASLSDGTRFKNLAETPSTAISLGMASIIAAKQVMLIATGMGKADALHKMVEGRSGPSVPASLLTDHHDLIVYADRDAACKLDPDLVADASV
jgi:glucosamine-6-phosphate deaminase